MKYMYRSISSLEPQVEQYVGCFQETKEYKLLYAHHTSQENTTIDSCIADCNKGNYTYAGLQVGFQSCPYLVLFCFFCLGFFYLLLRLLYQCMMTIAENLFSGVGQFQIILSK